ncbi:group II intron maturase-specific domain-containing protein (plasmid) [Bacillus cereus]
MIPKKKARTTVKAKIRELIQNAGAKPAQDLIKQINAVLTGWVNYFRIWNSSQAFSEVRDYTEMKIRTLLTRRKRRRKRSIGWQRGSNEYLYGVLGLYWDWKVLPLKSTESFR